MLRAEFPRRANKTAVRVLLVWAVYSLPDSNWDQKGLTDNHPRVKVPGVGAREGGQGWGPRAHGLRILRETLEDKGARADSHLGIRALRLLPARRPPRAAPRGSHGLAAGLVALLILHAACHVRRELLGPTTRSLTRPSPKASPFSAEKLPGYRSRGGDHTNSNGHLPLPGAWGVHTPRRRGEPARGTPAPPPRKAVGGVGRRRDGRSEAGGRRAREKPNVACAGLKRRQSPGCSP